MTSQHKKKSMLSHSDAVKLLRQKEVQDDINSACAALFSSVETLKERFNYLAKQFHTIDLQRVAPSFAPKWESLRSEYTKLAWQLHTNAGLLAGRLHIFCTVVLPMIARKSQGLSIRSHQEKLQVLQTYMSISDDHASLTRPLMERTIEFNTALTTFYAEFEKHMGPRTKTVPRKSGEISHYLTDLADQVHETCMLNGKLENPDINYLLYVIIRVVGSYGRRPSRSKLQQQRIILQQDLSTIQERYRILDDKRNEVAHTLYANEIENYQIDAVTVSKNALSSLVSDEILAFESCLSLLISTWAILRSDCSGIFRWLNNPATNQVMPSIISEHEDNGTIYDALAEALKHGSTEPSRVP